ncbi:MAG: hypothetical protein LBD06_02755 [Candidatus Accumulibacter sp.]|nr:hypothetical protein [Accumulibacter sp.]
MVSRPCSARSAQTDLFSVLSNLRPLVPDRSVIARFFHPPGAKRRIPPCLLSSPTSVL